MSRLAHLLFSLEDHQVTSPEDIEETGIEIANSNKEITKRH